MTERSFTEAYGVLQQHAQTLRAQAEPNIDDLLTIVTESVEAYAVCKERIDAVEAALKAALDRAGVGGVGTAASQGATNAGQAAEAPSANSRPAERATSTIRRPVDPGATDGDDDAIPF